MAMPRMLARTKTIENRSKKYLEDALYKKIFMDGGSEASVTKHLTQFLKSSKRVYKWETWDTIRKLRDRKLFSPALKLSETMSRRGMNKTVGDQAIHLYLLAKARGILAAEEYFVGLPDSSKNHLTYGSLLNCYCQKSMTEEAEALFEKMKELQLATTSMPYNSLMTMYTQMGKPERIPEIIQEMKANSVELNSYTYNVWMRAFSAVNDIGGVQRVSDELNRDSQFVADWTTYSNLASIYADAGMLEKANIALKELEKRNDRRDILPFQYLITLYGRIGNLQEVYRIWRSLRLAFPKTANVSYLNMIQSLVLLNDLPGAEKCFKEWEVSRSTYDIRIANVLIGAYAKQGSIDKAEEFKLRALQNGAKPNAKTWEIFLVHYLNNKNFKKAVECLANAVTIGRGNGEKWIPSPETVHSVMSYFEQEKDVEGAEGLIAVLKKALDKLNVKVYESLLRTYVSAGKTNALMRRRLKMENVEVNDECDRLLQAVCPE